MRILFLSLTNPLPTNNGHRMRTWSLLRALAEEGSTITLLTFAEPGEHLQRQELRQVCEEVEVVSLPLPRISSGDGYAGRLRGLVTGLPFGLLRFSSPVMQARIRAGLEFGNFDAVVCETAYMLVNCPGSLPVPLVLDNHNLEHQLIQRYIACEKNLAKRAYAWLEWRNLRRWEKLACSRAQLVLACSESDRLAVMALSPNARVAVVPNAVDLDGSVGEDSSGSEIILFTGGMDWFPNRDAVEFFLDRVLPLVRRECAGVRFVVAGRSASEPWLRRMSHVAGVEFTGTVADMRPILAKAAVCVVPLRIGSGTRLKILEAAALAKPVVSTKVGAEGLDFIDGEEILIADEPEQFASSVLQLLRNSSLRGQIGCSARRRLEQQYSFPSLRSAIRNVLSVLASDPNSVAHERIGFASLSV